MTSPLDGFTPYFEAFCLPGGINSKIVYERYPTGKILVVARYGEKKGSFTFHEASDVYRDLLQYQAELKARKVPLPPIERILIEYDHAAERASVLKVAPWTGFDVQGLIREANPTRDQRNILRYAREMARILVPVCKDRLAGWETKVGIDPRCSNFTVDQRGKMWFVDLFPARYRKHGQPIIEWPEPKNELGRRLGYFKHYDVRGIALCTIAQLSRALPALRIDFETVVVRELSRAMSPSERETFERDLKKTPWHRLRKLLRVKKPTPDTLAAIRGLIERAATEQVFGVEYNVYTLRELALELAASGRMGAEQLEAFFKASHFEDDLPEATIRDLQNRLLSFMGDKKG